MELFLLKINFLLFLVQVSDLQELDQAIDNLVIKLGDGDYRCSACGKISAKYHVVRAHCETHIETAGFSCEVCQKVFKTRNSFRVHKSLKHRTNAPFMPNY